MDIRQIRTFVHVAELGSLSKAADRLRTAQPALSRQVRLLEAELETPLFIRHGRGMVLTPAGETLLVRALAILRDLEAARADVAAQTKAVKGRVTLGTPPTIGDALSAPLVERFLSQYPDVAIRIVPAFSGYLMDWLQRGEIDLAVLYEPDARHNLKIQRLTTETLFAVSAARSHRATDRAIPFASVLDQRLILPGPQHGLRRLIERAALKLDRRLDVVVEADSLQTMKDLVERGLGWTILPPASVMNEVKQRRLQARPIAKPALTRTMVLAEAIGRPVTRPVQLFRDALIAEVGALVRSKRWPGTTLI